MKLGGVLKEFFSALFQGFITMIITSYRLTRVTAFLQTILFLEQFWREFGISFKSHKNLQNKSDSKTYKTPTDFDDVLVSLLIT